MEFRLWKAVSIEKPAGEWYREVGQGMGPTLNIAAGLSGYTLTDRATWASFRNRQELEILAEGDPALFNPYGSILVNPAKGAYIKAADAKVKPRSTASLRSGASRQPNSRRPRGAQGELRKSEEAGVIPVRSEYPALKPKLKS